MVIDNIDITWLLNLSARYRHTLIHTCMSFTKQCMKNLHSSCKNHIRIFNFVCKTYN